MLRSVLILSLVFSTTGCITTDGVKGLMEYGSTPTLSSVDLKRFNDYELCARSFDAFSDGGRSSTAYKDTVLEIRDRELSCKQYA